MKKDIKKWCPDGLATGESSLIQYPPPVSLLPDATDELPNERNQQL